MWTICQKTIYGSGRPAYWHFKSKKKAREFLKKLIEDNSNLKQENKNLYKILEEKTQPASNN